MRLIALFFFFFLALSPLFAQTDTEFWFAAPEVSFEGPGLTSFDRPIYLHFSTYEEAAEVQVTMPANSGFSPITFEIPSSSFYRLDLTPFIETLENKVPNATQNKGLHITASASVSCYYEVASENCRCNPELFTLKGKNALGNEFYVLGQNDWDNSFIVQYSPTPFFSFDIVATEDNTHVEITPTEDIVGHAAGQTFSVRLQKGETFSCKATSQRAAAHPIGSHVLADKPIAITMKDDLLYYSNAGVDLLGDQLTPISFWGTDYLVVRGALEVEGEAAYVVAAEDNTAVATSGSSVGNLLLQAGEVGVVPIEGNILHLQADKKVGVLHFSGYEKEFAGAVMPPITCNGSSELSFNLVETDFLAFTLLVQDGGQNAFSLNGDNNLLNRQTFLPVRSTGGAWYYTRFVVPLTAIPPNKNFRIKNTASKFHLGVITGGRSGMRYGFFSNFDKERVLSALDTVRGCGETPVNLAVEGGFVEYQWSTGETTPQISVAEAGEYHVLVNGACGEQEKTFWVTYEEEIALNLPEEVQLDGCAESGLVLDAGAGYESYLWNDGSTSRFLNVQQVGTYTVEVHTGGCVATASIDVIEGESSETLFVPNVITPSQRDGKNDVFKLPSALEGASLNIFDRWGKEVFHASPYENNWSAENVEGHVFFYVITHTSSCLPNPIRGFVSVITPEN